MADCRPQTYEHIQTVQRFMGVAIRDLLRRAEVHDQSKLVSPEREGFDEFTPKLSGSTYGTPEYEELRKGLGDVLAHHYAENDHHPEHDGLHVCIQCGADDRTEPCTCGGPRRASLGWMNLCQLMELICDWSAAARRHNNGDIRDSLEINQKRYGYSDELKQILLNTLDAIGA